MHTHDSMHTALLHKRATNNLPVLHSIILSFLVGVLALRKPLVLLLLRCRCLLPIVLLTYGTQHGTQTLSFQLPFDVPTASQYAL